MPSAREQVCCQSLGAELVCSPCCTACVRRVASRKITAYYHHVLLQRPVVVNFYFILRSCRADGFVNSGKDGATGVASQTQRRLHTPRQPAHTLAYVRLGPICAARSAAGNLTTRLHTHVSVRSVCLVPLPLTLALMVLSTHGGHGPRLA